MTDRQRRYGDRSPVTDEGTVPMSDYLPKVYVDFTERYPQLADAQGELARRISETSPFDERTNRLLKLALAIGAQSEGAVRSNARKALQHGASPDDLRAVALLAMTTCGFPTCVAGLGWLDQVVSSPADEG